MRILLAIDFVDTTDRLLHAVLPLAQATGAEVHLLHVAEPDPEFVGYDAGPAASRAQVAYEEQDEQRMLNVHARVLQDAGIRAESRLLRGPIAKTILGEAARLSADLIVMGTHGRSALYEAVVGGVSQAVLRETRTPVMLVPVRKT